MTEIYNHWSSESLSNAVGHVGNDGVVYNHWSSESISDTVGHIGRDGVIYNHWSSESLSNAVGHVGKDGVVYDHWSSESLSNAIGHVGKDGVVYDHWSSESLSNAIGHVKGIDRFGAGAAYLLLLAGRSTGSSASSAYGSSAYGSSSSGSNYSSSSSSSSSSSGGGGGGGGGCAMILGFPVLIGIIYLLSSEARVANMATVLSVVANIGAVIFFLWQVSAGKQHFAPSGGRFVKGLLSGIGVYIAATAILILLGLISNIGTGNTVSDRGEDQLELAALFMGLPFVYGSLFAEGPKPGSNTGSKPSQSQTTKTNTFNQPKPQAPKTQAPKTQTPKPHPPKPEAPKVEPQPVIVFCPNCGAKCRVPGGKGRIRITCPNPNCRQPFETNT